jgi:hypothetical protein
MAVLWFDEPALAPQAPAGMGLDFLWLAVIFAAGQGLGGERAWVGMRAPLLPVTA